MPELTSCLRTIPWNCLEYDIGNKGHLKWMVIIVLVTYILFPCNLVVSWMRFHFTLKVYIISFFDIWGFKLWSKCELNLWLVYNIMPCFKSIEILKEILQLTWRFQLFWTVDCGILGKPALHVKTSPSSFSSGVSHRVLTVTLPSGLVWKRIVFKTKE